MRRIIIRKYHLKCTERMVMMMLQQADPVSVSNRRNHRPRRRTYVSRGPNHTTSWLHMVFRLVGEYWKLTITIETVVYTVFHKIVTHLHFCNNFRNSWLISMTISSLYPLKQGKQLVLWIARAYNSEPKQPWCHTRYKLFTKGRPLSAIQIERLIDWLSLQCKAVISSIVAV